MRGTETRVSGERVWYDGVGGFDDEGVQRRDVVRGNGGGVQRHGKGQGRGEVQTAQHQVRVVCRRHGENESRVNK